MTSCFCSHRHHFFAPTRLRRDSVPFASSSLDVARATIGRSREKMDGQNSELVKQQVQAELANAYAQEFFTVRMPDLVLDLFPTLRSSRRPLHLDPEADPSFPTASADGEGEVLREVHHEARTQSQQRRSHLRVAVHGQVRGCDADDLRGGPTGVQQRAGRRPIML